MRAAVQWTEQGKKIELNHWLHLKRRIANEYNDDGTSALRVNANLRPPCHSSGSSAALRCTQLTVLVGPLSYRSLRLITSFLGLPHLSCVGMLKLSAEHYFRHYFLLVCSMWRRRWNQSWSSTDFVTLSLTCEKANFSAPDRASRWSWKSSFTCPRFMVACRRKTNRELTSFA